MLEITIITLFSIAIILFILSFFRKDRTTQLEKQLEDLSMTYMQDIYQLNKKVELLEDELLIQPHPSSFQTRSSSQQQLLQEVITYYELGDEPKIIAKKTGLTPSEVNRILLPYLEAEDEVNN